MFGLPLAAIVVTFIVGVSAGFIAAAIFTAGTIEDLRSQATRLRRERDAEAQDHAATRAKLVRLTDRDERGRFVRREEGEAI